MPIVTVLDNESTPALIDDNALTEKLQKVFVAKLGAENVIPQPPVMGSEDFGIFSMKETIPAVMFRLGAYDPAKVAESKRTGVPLPSPHSPFFAPLPEPTLRTGVTAMTDAAVALLQ
jgi:hippurate hydrolase